MKFLSRKIAAFLTVAFVLLVSSVQLPAVPAFVSHVAFVFENGTVIFYRGEQAGVTTSDIFEVVRDGEVVSVLKAEEVKPFYTRARILMGDGEVREDDMVVRVETLSETDRPSSVEELEPSTRAMEEATVVSVGKTEEAPAEQVVQEEPEEEKSEKEKRKEEMRKRMKIDLTGYRYLKYRSYESSGNYTSFLSRNGLITQGNTYEQGTQLQINMNYMDKVELEGNFFELPFQERELKLEMRAGMYNALFGDFSTTFRSGTIARIDKKITGMQFQYTTGKVEIDYLMSQSKSTPTTASFYGDNTHGPYSLRAVQILEDSETVKVNGQTVSPDEYDIDYYIGQITFCAPGDSTKCRIIKSSDQVQVQFEEQLLLDLKGGNIIGISSKYRVSDNAEIGVAHIVQQANRSAQRIRESATFSITGSEIPGQENCPDDTLCLPKGYEDQYTLMVKSFEKVYKNGDTYTGYTIDDEGYARGEFTLTEAYSDTDVFAIEYTYYIDDYVNSVTRDDENGKIRSPDGSESVFVLPKSTIYEGTERVFFCQGDVEDTCDFTQTLTKGVDYDIFEDTNTIQLNSVYAPNDLMETFIHVTYVYVPTSSADSSKYDHTVSEVFGKATIGPVAISFESGQSESDLSRMPVQVLKEQLFVSNSSYTCATSVPPPVGCRFSLEHVNLVELSDTVVVNTRSQSLSRGVDYEVDYDSGLVTFKNDLEFATGTIARIDYQYYPDVGGGIVTGNSTRITAETQLRRFDVSFALEGTDAFFSPISGNNDLETSRTEFSIAGPITDSFNVAYEQSKFEVAQDVYESSSTSNTQTSTTLSYQTAAGHSLEYSFGKDQAVDSLRTHKVDTERTFSDIAIGTQNLLTPEMNVQLAVGKEDYVDNTGNGDNTSSTSRTVNIDYRRGNALELEATIGTDEIENSGTSGDYSSTTNTRNYLVSYYPTKKISLEADINHQTKEDSREEGATSRDSSSLRINSRPFGNFKGITLSFMNQSYPSYSGGTTNSKTTYLSINYGLTNALTLSPSFNRTDTSSPESYTENNRNVYKMDYRPAGKKYASTVTYEQGDNLSQNTSGTSTTGEVTRMYWDFLYKLNDKTNFIYRFDDVDNSYSTGSFSLSTSHTYDIEYQRSEKQLFTFQFKTTDRSDASTSAADTQYVFESDVALSKILRWVTQVRRSSYDNGSRPEEGYTGTLIETELRAEFK